MVYSSGIDSLDRSARTALFHTEGKGRLSVFYSMDGVCAFLDNSRGSSQHGRRGSRRDGPIWDILNISITYPESRTDHNKVEDFKEGG